MRAQISPADSDETTVTIDRDTSIRIFRSPDRREEIVVKKEATEKTIPLGIHDLAVSREFDDAGEPGYIEFFWEDRQLYVRDAGSANGAVQRNAFGEIDLSDGTPTLITGDCTVGLGHDMSNIRSGRGESRQGSRGGKNSQKYSTELHVEVEQSQRSTSAIPYKADLVKKISDVRPADEVRSETKELMNMMRESNENSNKRYQTLLEDLEVALANLRNANLDDATMPLPEQQHGEQARQVANVARRIRNFYHD